MPTIYDKAKSFSTTSQGSLYEKAKNIVSQIEKPAISEIPTAVKTYPSTMEALAELRIDPLSLKADPTKFLSEASKNIKDTFTNQAIAAAQFVDSFTPKERPISEKIGAGLKLFATSAGVFFTPITTLFQVAKTIPVLGSVARLIEVPIVALGETGSNIANKLVDELPINKQAKENIREGTNEIGALAFQLGGLKVGIETQKVIKTKMPVLIKKFGKQDAQTIIDKAQEIVEMADKPIAETLKREPILAPTITEISKISKELEPLAQEARKIAARGGTAEEFVGNLPGSTFFKEVGSRGEFKIMKIDDLPRPLAKVPSQEAIKSIENTLKTKPIVIDETGIIKGVVVDKTKPGIGIVDGNNRLAAARAAGIKEIPVISLDKTKSQLTDFYNQVVSEVKPRVPARKYIEVPREQLPVRLAEAEKGVSALEARMKGIFETQNVKKAKVEAEARGLDISVYDKMNKPEQLRMSAKYVEKTPQYKVLEVLEGKREAPKGLLNNAIMLALEEKSLREKNVNLAIKLASLRSTRMGQEISILTEVEGLSPVSGMNEIIRARRSAAEGKLKYGEKLETKKASMVKEIKTEQTKFQMKMVEVETLLRSITCK